MATQLRTVEREIARIARRAHGVVTRAELLAAGVSVDEIAHRVRRGALIAVFRGVYRVGHAAPSVEARYISAVKAAGEGGVLSGLAAAHLFGLINGGAPSPAVIAPTERRVRGVRTSRVRLDDRDKTVWRGVPVTTLPRTLVDLSSLLPSAQLASAFHEANVRYRTSPAHVEAPSSARRGRRAERDCAA